MGSIYNTNLYRNSIICFTASTFIASTLTMPLHAYRECKAQVEFNLNDIAFAARIEKLVESKKIQGQIRNRKTN